jgi:hypothetical protein
VFCHHNVNGLQFREISQQKARAPRQFTSPRVSGLNDLVLTKHGVSGHFAVNTLHCETYLRLRPAHCLTHTKHSSGRGSAPILDEEEMTNL